ncbi:cytochrome P450 [Fomitopsis betulina]|nr:cytochrome P450 [Fomitopsis betulina]
MMINTYVIYAGIPHEVMEEDHYRGYRIPKQAMIIANLWHIARDPDIYADPDQFLPERYPDMDIKPLERTDPRKIIFGFGRRLCPGRQLADSSVWLAIACMLATRRGRGNVDHPKPFMCCLSPRSRRIEEFVRELSDNLQSQE